MNLDYVDIREVIKSLKKSDPFKTRHDLRDYIKNRFEEGVLFKDRLIKVISVKYTNKILNEEDYKHYFKCPKCSSKVLKIYSEDPKTLSCRKCCKVKFSKSTYGPSDRIIQIQKNLHDIFEGKISNKKKKILINNIVNHYNMLDDKYKLAYNTFVFKELQNWCSDKLVCDNASSEYKKAMKDVLSILRSSREILVKTGLSKPNKNKLKI